MFAVESSAIADPTPDLDYLEMIEQLIGSMSQVGDRKKVLSMILPYALSLTSLESGALLVAGDAPNQLSMVARRDLPDEIVNQLSGGSLGGLLLMGQQLWIKPRPMELGPEQALLGRHKFKYLFGVPCRFEGRVLGAIVVGSRTVDQEWFGPKQQDHVAALAQLLAVFLDNVRLRAVSVPVEVEKAAPAESPSNPTMMEAGELEQLLAAIMDAEEEVVSQNRDLELLNELSGQIIGMVQLNQVLETAITQTCTALQIQVGWCYLQEEGQLRLRKYQGLSAQYVQSMNCLVPGTGVEGMAFSRNEIIARDSSLFHTGQARQLVREEKLGLVAAVPLHIEGRPIGVLAVSYGDRPEWSVRDKRMLLLIGRQVEQALLGALEYDEAREEASNWESNYQSLLQSNKQLIERTQMLETQVALLHQLERQIWGALSTSPSTLSRSSRRDRKDPGGSKMDEALAMTLKTILTALNRK